MKRIIDRLFQEYLPRRIGMQEDRAIIYPTVALDAFIFFICFSLASIILYDVIRKRTCNPIYGPLSSLLYFLAIVHALDIIAIWHTYYWLLALMKLGCVVSGVIILYRVYDVPGRVRMWQHIIDRMKK